MLMAVALILTACSAERSAARQAERQRVARQVEQLIDSHRFSVTATAMRPLRGGRHTLTQGYGIDLKDDMVTVFLPYVGEVRQATYGTGVSLNFTSPVGNYQERRTTDRTYIAFTVINQGYKHAVRLEIFNNGKCSIDVDASHIDPISYEGYMETAPQGS